jgi:outer membrane receptor protein involved in Fe transport
VDANLTLVDSRILEYDAATSVTGTDQFGLLPGTSKVTWNLAGFYEAHGLQLRLSSQYVSHSLFGLGGDKALDVLQDKRLTMDFTSSYEFTHNFTGYFNVKNLLNTPLRYYEGSSDRPIQREFYDVTYEAGVRAKF